MKRVLLYIGIATAAIGCTKSEITGNTPSSGEISFTAGVATTRVDADDDCQWAADGKDQIGIFTSTGESNLLFSVASDGTMTNEKDVFLVSDGSERTYYAYHPYSTAQDETTKISFDLTAGCSTPLLWASETTSDTEVELQFTHMLPKVTFNITAGGLDVSSYDATVTLRGANATASFDIESGEFSSQTTGDITLTTDGGTVTAYLMPMAEVSGNVELYVTAEGDTYVYPMAEGSWLSGNEYEYKITIGEVDNNIETD